MRRLALALLVAACGGGGAPPNVDAHPEGPLCSKQVYDKCTAEHDCEAPAQCISFGTIQVCSPQCTPGGAACPVDKNGMPGTCEVNACKPSAPNMCHLE